MYCTAYLRKALDTQCKMYIIRTKCHIKIKSRNNHQVTANRHIMLQILEKCIIFSELAVKCFVVKGKEAAIEELLPMNHNGPRSYELWPG